MRAAMRGALVGDGRITVLGYRALSAWIGDDEIRELIIDSWETK
jgi:hypothetical protein